jgi:cyclic dehypoxanthinyl futalosine synthase
VVFFSERFKLPVADVIKELRAAGLDSIPGGGGEILVDSVRGRVAPKKAQTEEWLGVQEEAHRQGMRTSATMMYGMGESDEDRVESIFRIRDLQRRTGGFTAFICWPLQPDGTPMFDGAAKTDAVTYLRTLALMRIVADNVPNMQASWVTMGHKVGQVALRFGANDYGSLMMEENVVSATGTTYNTTLREMDRLISDAGFTPRRRRQDYSLLPDHQMVAA